MYKFTGMYKTFCCNDFFKKVCTNDFSMIFFQKECTNFQKRRYVQMIFFFNNLFQKVCTK